MAYENLKNAIKQVIKQNGNQEITGPILQSTLLSMVDNVPEVVQESGEAEDKDMSQKEVSDKLDNLALEDSEIKKELPKKANTSDVQTSLEKLKKEIGDRIVVEGNVTNLPDEEDITSGINENGIDVLSFKDRVYSPLSLSGKGYKILRKNIKPVSLAVTKIIVESIPTADGTIVFTVNGVKVSIDMVTTTMTSTDLVAQKIAEKLTETMTEYKVSKDASTIILTRKFGGSVTPSVFSASTTSVVCTVADSTKQELRNILTPTMVNQANTIYEVRYDFDLNGETIQMQEGCTLKFEGGSLNNGELNPNNVYIYNNTDKCIFYNMSFTHYYLFNDKLVFQDYWIDNIFKSKILGYVRYFNLTQSHVYDNQEDLVDARVLNLHKEGIVIYGNNNSITFNTDNWTKKGFVLLDCEYIYMYNVNLVQNHPTSLLTDCISAWFNSKVFHFINSTFNGYGRLNANWSWWADKDNTKPDKGIGSELKFINSSCKSHSFISEGRFDKVIIEDSEILRPKNRKDYDDKIWGPECLSIGCNSTGYTNRDECYIHINNSKLSNNAEEISHSMAYNENGIDYSNAGWEGLNDRGYKYITVENSVLYNFIIVPEGGTTDGRWNTMDTICTYNNCTFTYAEDDYTVHHIKLNLHNKYIFNNCILAVDMIIQSTHHVEFNNCTIKNTINGSSMKLIPDDFKCIFKNTTLEYTPIFFKSLNSEQLKKYVSFINAIFQNDNIKHVIHSSDKIFYIPFDGFIINELNLYEMLTDNIVHGYLKASFGQSEYGTTIKPVFYNPEIQDFEFEDGTNINYITY